MFHRALLPGIRSETLDPVWGSRPGPGPGPGQARGESGPLQGWAQDFTLNLLGTFSKALVKGPNPVGVRAGPESHGGKKQLGYTLGPVDLK